MSRPDYDPEGDGHPLGTFNGLYWAVVWYAVAFAVGYLGFKLYQLVVVLWM